MDRKIDLDKGLEKILARIEEKAQELKRERRIQRLTRTCQTCELLGICRDEQNDWKCRNGCMLMEKN